MTSCFTHYLSAPPTEVVVPSTIPVPPLRSAATQTTSGTKKTLSVTLTAAQLPALVNEAVDYDYSSPGPSLVAARCNSDDYLGDLGEFQSAKMKSDEFKTIKSPLDDKASTMRVTVPPPKSNKIEIEI